MERNLEHPERHAEPNVARSPFDFATREEYRQWKGREQERTSKRRGSGSSRRSDGDGGGKEKKMGLIDRAVAEGLDRFNRPDKYDKTKKHPPIKKEVPALNPTPHHATPPTAAHDPRPTAHDPRPTNSQEKKRALPNWKAKEIISYYLKVGWGIAISRVKSTVSSSLLKPGDNYIKI
jgi:hypothetical protein